MRWVYSINSEHDWARVLCYFHLGHMGNPPYGGLVKYHRLISNGLTLYVVLCKLRCKTTELHKRLMFSKSTFNMDIMFHFVTHRQMPD